MRSTSSYVRAMWCAPARRAAPRAAGRICEAPRKPIVVMPAATPARTPCSLSSMTIAVAGVDAELRGRMQEEIGMRLAAGHHRRAVNVRAERAARPSTSRHTASRSGDDDDAMQRATCCDRRQVSVHTRYRRRWVRKLASVRRMKSSAASCASGRPVVRGDRREHVGEPLAHERAQRILERHRYAELGDELGEHRVGEHSRCRRSRRRNRTRSAASASAIPRSFPRGSPGDEHNRGADEWANTFVTRAKHPYIMIPIPRRSRGLRRPPARAAALVANR